MIIDTERNGQPICPICETDVEVEGHFCSYECWNHFHVVLFDDTTYPLIEMNYLDIEHQPWYRKLDPERDPDFPYGGT